MKHHAVKKANLQRCVASHSFGNMLKSSKGTEDIFLNVHQAHRVIKQVSTL